MGGWLRSLDGRAAEDLLQGAGVAAGVALHPRLELQHPAFHGRGYPVEMDQPGCGPLFFEGPAMVGTRMGSPESRPAPALSEHSERICRELLGCDAREMQELIDTGALDRPAD